MENGKKHEMSTCIRCEGKPVLQYSLILGRVRVSCSWCHSHTEWHDTRWEAYEDWEDMQC